MSTFLRLPATLVISGSFTCVHKNVEWLIVKPSTALAASTSCNGAAHLVQWLIHDVDRKLGRTSHVVSCRSEGTESLAACGSVDTWNPLSSRSGYDRMSAGSFDTATVTASSGTLSAAL